MTANPPNSLRAELYADRRKILMFNIGLFMFLATCWYISCYFISDPAKQFAGMLGVLVFFVIFTHENWGLLFRSPHLKLYDNGMEFKGLGFWEWGDFGGVHSHEDLHFVLICRGREVPRKFKNIVARNYYYDADKDTAVVRFKFPMFTSNIPVKEFYNALYRYAPVENRAEPDQKRDTTKTRRTLVLGNEEATRKDIVIHATMLPVMALCLYAMSSRGFFPSAEWAALGKIIVWILTIAGTAAFYWAYYRGEIKLSVYKNQKTRGVFTLIALPLFGWMFLWTGLGLGLGHAYTEAFGTDKSMVIVAFKKEHPDNDERCLKSEDLKTGFMKDLCIQREHYVAMPDRFKMEAQGKQTWFGFVFKRYRLPKAK